MSDAIEAQGTILRIGNTATPVVYTAIGEVKSFDGPSGTASVIDVSHLQSTRREKRMGLPDEGQLTLNGNYVGGDAGQAALRTARSARAIRPFQIEFTDGELWDFEGFVLGLPVSGGVDAVVEFSATIEISGEITVTEP